MACFTVKSTDIFYSVALALQVVAVPRDSLAIIKVCATDQLHFFKSKYS